MPCHAFGLDSADSWCRPSDIPRPQADRPVGTEPLPDAHQAQASCSFGTASLLLLRNTLTYTHNLQPPYHGLSLATVNVLSGCEQLFLTRSASPCTSAPTRSPAPDSFSIPSYSMCAWNGPNYDYR